MGLFEKLIKQTPLNNSYQKYKVAKAINHHKKLEEKLFPIRVQFYNQIINKADLVFDVGANVGNRVEAFLACEGNVIAIEPQPNCVEMLIQKFGNSIIIENVGLSDKEGNLEMKIASDSTISTFNTEYISKTKERFKYSKWEGTINVKITTLDKLIEKYGIPMFCKIDVEGFELQVLKGLHSIIPYISFEYCVPEMHEQALNCLKHLNDLSPNATYNYSIGETMQWTLKNWLNFSNFIQHVNSKEFNTSLFGDIYIKSN